MDVMRTDIRSYTYGGETAPTLRNLRLSIAQGELVVLTGNSGCGKTTLTRIMNGLIPGQYEGELQGRVTLLGKDLHEHPTGELAKAIGNVFQNPSDQFFARKAEDEVALVGENLGMEREELEVRVKDAFARMNIAHLMSKNLSELSGGEKQRVAIASTLVYDTRLIFFDEPSASLDQEGIEDFREILIELKAQEKAMVIAEHRLYFLADLYDRLYVMEGGGIAETFSAGQLAAKDCKRYGLRAIELSDLSAENKSSLGQAVASVSDATVKVKNRILVNRLSFKLRENEIMGIVGSNGIGKSTLARTLCGLGGGKQAVSWGARPHRRRASAFYMMQDVDYQLFFDTVENEILSDREDADAAFLDRVSAIIKQIDLWDKRTDHPQELSGGQKQRLAVANAFLSKKQIVVLDEPTSGLDFLHMEKIADLIQGLSGGRPVMVITHDLEFLLKTCNSVLLVKPEGCEKLDVRTDDCAQVISYFSRARLCKDSPF